MHGFKSFATKTSFVFDPGITAVVGPNGSGKSNISDAIRWVLGETSSNALRSRKTEDVIFAGGKGRAPAGLAEVTVTFDNEDQWLPSEFTEVTVTRRAYRGGDNQYFINGRRVRLKDVAFLTASLGQSHTVVGQGLVDAALSQRAEERRGLFEHAADLTGLRIKVHEAERNLTEADSNVERLTDLLTELEPRLKSMERQAKQAREWQGLRDRLTFLQLGHYHRLLVASTARFADAERLIEGDQHELDQVRARIDGLTLERASLTEKIATVREQLATHQSQLTALAEQTRRVEHERDLVSERQSALNRRRDDMQETQSGLDEQVTRVAHELSSLATGLATLESESAAARATVDSLHAAARELRQQRADLERQATNHAKTLAGHERTVTELQQQRALLDQRRETANAEQERATKDVLERGERIQSLEREVAAFETEDAKIVVQIGELESRIGSLQQSIADHQKKAQDATALLAEIDRKHGQATNRFEVLQRVHESSTGLHAGVRQVMQWSRYGSLQGIRGTIAELITVEATYDTALEVALGGHLQDVVVDRWQHAEAAIDMLKRARAGRATFQPIDTISRRDNLRPAPRELQNAAGVHGIAADLVRSADNVGPVVRALLGRIVIVDDLPSAREVLATLPNGWSTVTLAGEIARSGGAVTGGSAVRESGVLGRERELRELPQEIATLANRRVTAEEQQSAIAAEMQTTIDERGRIESDRIGLIAQRRERAGQRDRLTTWLRDMRTQREAAERRISAVTASRDDHERTLAALELRQTELVVTISSARHAHTEALAAIESHQATVSGDDDALGEAQQALAALDERIRAERRRESSLKTQQQALADETTLRSQRVAELDRERGKLATQLARLEQEFASLQESHAGASDGQAPLLANVRETESAQQLIEQRIETTRQELLQRERDLGQRGLVVERARAELAAIHQRIVDDFEDILPEELLATTPDTVFAADGTPLEADHQVVEREIGRLRDRLRRVGYVGGDIVDEFEKEAAHHLFLRDQLADVQTAAASLRQLLAELHETMSTRFAATFAKVATEFTKSFVTLFGGGTARLVLTADDEGAPGGIDIVAQPPGKRLQGLALLSGGERSLTAVALLFAILRVNPSPFLLLDEVDAALDEANVVRFRDELRTLASQTQAIVITHNRGTVEIADTLYGITMGGDGVSQMLSLRLSEMPLDEDIDIRDLPSVVAGVPIR
ncbi:MAG: chromosome segregation protein SMC [Thermomicrobiales bacterium]